MKWQKGMKWTKEQRKKISESMKGREPWNKGKVGMMPVPWNKGQHLSEATKKKISKARKGGTSWNAGLKWDEETLTKIKTSTKLYHANKKI